MTGRTATTGKIRSMRAFIILFGTFSVLIGMLVASLFFYLRISCVLTEQTRRDIDQSLDRINDTVQAQVELIDDLFPAFVANPIIQEYLEPTSANYQAAAIEKKIEIERQMSYLLLNMYLWNKKFIRAVYLFDRDGNSYSVSKSYGGSELEENRRVAESIPRDGTSLSIRSSNSGRKNIYFARTINSVYVGDYIATIVVDVNEEAFRETYAPDAEGGYIVALVNGRGEALSSTGELSGEALRGLFEVGGSDGQGEAYIGDRAYFVAARRMSMDDMRSVVAVPKGQVFQGLNHTLFSFFPLLAVMLVVMLALAVVLSTIFTRPIHSMMRRVRQISGGDLSVEIPQGVYAEFNELANAINHMLTKINDYYHEIYQQQILLKEAEIKSLQAQINPHFLFNVLDTIGWKAQMAGNEEISDMVISLGGLLRANVLNSQNDETRLRDEFTYIKFYLYLQKMRFEDKFLTDIQISDDRLLDCIVPRLSVQPLVENAIVHGLEGKEEQGHLYITVLAEDGVLRIEVADDGVGFAVGSLDKKARDDFSEKHTHIGVQNIDRRIALLYGPRYGLTIESSPGAGTRATIRIPIQKEGEI